MKRSKQEFPVDISTKYEFHSLNGDWPTEKEVQKQEILGRVRSTYLSSYSCLRKHNVKRNLGGS